jgi:hypothetical protein
MNLFAVRLLLNKIALCNSKADDYAVLIDGPLCATPGVDDYVIEVDDVEKTVTFICAGS